MNRTNKRGWNCPFSAPQIRTPHARKVDSFVMIFRLKQGMLRTLAVAMAGGLGYHFIVLT